jgi:hypothetical protein
MDPTSHQKRAANARAHTYLHSAGTPNNHVARKPEIQRFLPVTWLQAPGVPSSFRTGQPSRRRAGPQPAEQEQRQHRGKRNAVGMARHVIHISPATTRGGALLRPVDTSNTKGLEIK